MAKASFRQALVLTFAIWFVFVYGGYCVSELIAGRTGFLRDMPLDLIGVLIVALIAQCLYPIACRTAGWRIAPRAALLLGAVFVAAVLQATVNLVENRALGTIVALDAAHADAIRTRFASSFLSHAYLSLANAALLVFLVEARRSSEQRVVLARAEAAAAEARTVALRLQLNPHFVFNTLNSISSLIVTRRLDDAEEMIDRLSDFLRQSLVADPHALVPLEEEFATAETYLDIEAVRFGDRLIVELDCPPALAQAAVPSYILQPLVENAVKYGVACSPRPVTVRVLAQQHDGRLCVKVCDDAHAGAAGEAPGGFGIGVENISQRLAARFGAEATISTERDPDGYVATVSLPLALPDPA